MAALRSMSDNFSSDSEELTFGFGWTRAVIQECLVVVVINGAIAWFVFRGRTDIVWLGWGGIYAYLFPMSMILSFFTSFFGYRLGCEYRRLKGKSTKTEKLSRWWLGGILTGILSSLTGAMFMVLGLWLGDYLWPNLEFSHLLASLIVCVLAAIMAAVFHPVAIRLGMSGGFFTYPQSS